MSNTFNRILSSATRNPLPIDCNTLISNNIYTKVIKLDGLLKFSKDYENNDYYIGGDRQTGHIGGVYKKNGEWGNWERIVSGMDNLNIIYLTIGPENYLYALAQGYPDNSRIYKSINLIN